MPIITTRSRKKKALDTAPAPYSDDVFSTLLYTGTGASQTFYPGFTDMDQGSMFMSRYRSGSPTYNDMCIWDTKRGPNSQLRTSLTTIAAAVAIAGWNPTNMVMSSVSQNTINVPYVGYFFKMAKAFFTALTYVGNGAATRTLSHDLQCDPGMVVGKSWSGSANTNWNTWHRSVIGTLNLNTTSQPGTPVASIIAADSSTVTVDSTLNATGTTYELLIFAHDIRPEGVIFCGGIQSDANGVASIYTGWPIQSLWFKKTNGTSDWQIYDSARGWANYVTLNTTVAEAATTYLSANSTGLDVANLGANNKYVFMAIRARNKPNTSPNTLTINGGNSIDVYAQAIANGWDQVSPLSVNVTADVGSNSTSTPALSFNGSYPDVTLTVNSGVYVCGRGGLGVRNAVGQPGGPAIKTTGAIKIINNGVIGGGGGSGGGYSYSSSYGYSGNGAGLPVLAIAGTGSSGMQATPATKTDGGNGASGYNSSTAAGGVAGSNGQTGGGGGGGGGLGGTGGTSSNSSPGYTYSDPGNQGRGGAGLTDSDPTANSATTYNGGAPGPYIQGNANVTWLTAGTRYGTAT